MIPWTHCPACGQDDRETVRLTHNLGCMQLEASDDGVFLATDGRSFAPEWIKHTDVETLGFGLRCRACGALQQLQSPEEQDVEELLDTRWDQTSAGLDVWFGQRTWREETSPLPGEGDALIVDMIELTEESGLLCGALSATDLLELDPAVDVEALRDAHDDTVRETSALAISIDPEGSGSTPRQGG
jgi:hypothetical protein